MVLNYGFIISIIYLDRVTPNLVRGSWLKVLSLRVGAFPINVCSCSPRPMYAFLDWYMLLIDLRLMMRLSYVLCPYLCVSPVQCALDRCVPSPRDVFPRWSICTLYLCVHVPLLDVFCLVAERCLFIQLCFSRPMLGDWWFVSWAVVSVIT